MGLLLLGAAAAEAQTSRILVSNTVVANDETANTSGNDHAQLFHTGGHTGGYIFTSVHVNSEDTEGDDFDVEVCEEDGSADEFPSSTCTALTAPSDFTAGLVLFTGNLLLSANTNYVVVIKQRGTGSVRFKSTTNTGEDTSLGLTDWSIKNKFYWKSGSTWMIKSGSDEALRIVVSGYERISPDVSSVELTSIPTTYAIGDTVKATVTFSAAVDITGTPQLELDFAGTPKAANCTAATNTTTMVCIYTVAVNDSAPNGIAIAANKLTGGTITATGSTTISADLDHVAVAIDANHKVDGIRPTLVTTGSEAPTTSTDGTQVILTFSETIGSADRTKITIGIGGGNVASTSAARVAGTTVELDLSTFIDATVMLTVALAADAVEDAATNGILAVPATAVINAITDDPLVSNIGQAATSTSSIFTYDHAQGFTTGSNSAGYTLTSIEVQISTSGTIDSAVLRKTDPNTGDLVATLTGPSTGSSVGTGAQTFTAPSGTSLEPSTEYFVVFESDAATNGLTFSVTNTDAEDAGAAAGWSISDSGHFRNRTQTGNFTPFTGSKRIRVNGTINAITANASPTVTGVEITSDPGTPGTDSTYAVSNTVKATVTFSAAVDITGTPQLELDFAGTPKAANCTAATNTTTMVCIYTVAVNDSAPNGIAIAANKLTLNGGTITATGSTTISADLDHVAVAIDANHKVDGILPTLVTTGSEAPRTSTDGTQVILTFSEDVVSPDRGVMTIRAGGNVVSTSAASANGPRVDLTLTTALTSSTVVVTVALSFDAVLDAASNGNLAVPATAVINAIGSTTAPTVTAVALTSNPVYAAYHRNEVVEATVTFDAAVDITGTPELELDFAGTPKAAACTAATNTTTMVCSYRVAVGDSAPNGIAIAANKLTGGTITATGSTTVSADLDHAAVPIDAGHKVDGIRPTLVTTGTDAPTTSTDGTTVILKFSEDIRRVDQNLITIQANGVTLSATAASRDGDKAELTLATALTATATNLTVALASNSVFDAAGNGILFVAATAVTNAVVPPDPPDAPDSLKARRGDGEVHLEWVPVATDTTNPDRAYQLRYGAEGGEYNQWRDIPGSAPGGPHARSYTVTGLENGTRYAFELRVRRDSGFGTAAKIRQTPEAPRWSVSTNRRSVHEGEDVTLGIATRNAVGFYSAPEALTLAVIGEIVLEFATIDGADPEDYEIWADGNKVQGYTKDITFLNFDEDLDSDPFPAQHFDLEVPVGSTSLDVTVKVLADDDEEEGQEHMTFMVFREDSLVNADTWDETGVNIESRDAGVVKQLAVADAEATEGEDPSLDFVVTLAPAAEWTVAVDYATHDGTARAGADYTHTSGTLTFAPGETEKTVSVPVIDDTVEDTPETLTLRLSNADPPYADSGNVAWGSEEAGVLIADSVATGTIRNTEDQAEPPAVSVSDASAAEGDAVAFAVSLSAASSQQVTVDYATADGTATAGEDYTATSGTLTFQAGDTTKTVSVPITDDTEDDGGETFTLTLGNASGAALGDAEATGTIRNTETAAELSAGFPESAFTSKRHTGSDDRPQVVVAFSEAVAEFDKNTPSVSVTGASRLSVQAHTEDGLENAYVFFMTPDGNGDVTFALVADAACASGGICTAGGTELTQVPAAWTIPGPGEDSSSLSVADAEATEEEDNTMDFVVTLDPAASDTVTVDYATADGTATAGEDYTATSGTLTFQAGDTTKTVAVPITDDTEDDGGETFTLTLGNASSGVQLGDAEAAGTIWNTEAAAPLTASFSDMPASHTGAEFTFGLAFSEEVEVGYATLRDTAFTVTGGAVRQAQRQQQGSNLAWNITVEPASANDTVTITLPETTDCGASGAICTEDGRPLSHSLSSVVAGAVSTPAVSVSDASAAEGDAVAFTVSLSATSSQQVTVDYATSDGTATSGTDYTAASGTLTFTANETTKTVSVATTDDSADEENETFTLTLSSPANATLGDATATGTINDNDNAAPLTASFSDIPASHTGAEFTFGLTFSEEVEVGYVTLRDTAFAVTGGEVRQAQRQQQGSNLAWNIKVEPASANDTVIITLPETTDCGASGAICTEDGRPLSQSLSATVVDAASASAGDAANGDAADDPLALLDDLTTDEATEALFGERRLGAARLEALDRLGNQNGRYDLGDLLSWIERCRRGEARCGRTPADPGPASAAALLGAAALGRRRIPERPKRRDSGRRGPLPVRGMRRRARMAGYALAMLLAATMAWSCTGDFVGPPDAGQGPGFLTVEWTGPADARDIGVLLELEGPGIETVRAPGLDLYESRAPGRHQIILAGSLRAGPVVQFRVPDRGQPTLYRVRILQVTGEDYGLRDVGEYQAVITPH